MTSFVVKQKQCPKCWELGKDTSHDNLATYSDGHSFCYGCGYLVWPGKIQSLLTKKEEKVQESNLLLPEDCTTNYSPKAIDWIKQYEISENDLLLHGVLWSISTSRLIFPVFNVDSILLAWQGRYFGENENTKKKPKWFGKGNLRDTFNVLGKGNHLVLCEDIVSAIKISKCNVMAMPLYGCHIGRERFKRLYLMFGGEVEVSVWLDPDKRKEAVQEANLGRLCGLDTTVIFADLDPKEISFEEIKRKLNNDHTI